MAQDGSPIAKISSMLTWEDTLARPIIQLLEKQVRVGMEEHVDKDNRISLLVLNYINPLERGKEKLRQ